MFNKNILYITGLTLLVLMIIDINCRTMNVVNPGVISHSGSAVQSFYCTDGFRYGNGLNIKVSQDGTGEDAEINFNVKVLDKRVLSKDGTISFSCIKPEPSGLYLKSGRIFTVQ